MPKTQEYWRIAGLLGSVALGGLTFILGKSLFEDHGISLTDPRWVGDPHDSGSFVSQEPNVIALLLALFSAGVGIGGIVLTAKKFSDKDSR